MSDSSSRDRVARALADYARDSSGPMPPEVAARLQARIAAEPTAAARPARPRWRRPPVLVAAGLAAAAVIVGGALTVRGGGSATSGGTSASVASGRASGAHSSGSAAAAATRFLAGGQRYTPATLAGAAALATAPQLAAAAPAPATSPIPRQRRYTSAALGPPPSAPAGSALAGCLNALTLVPGSSPLAVDRAYFQGQPALIVVEPDTRGRLGIYAVSPSCSAASQHVRYFRSVPRPG